MKFTTFAAICLPAAVLAAPSNDAKTIFRRQEDATDELLFSVSLPTFISRREAQDPPTLDWSSDSCSSSPDNPFGFPFDVRDDVPEELFRIADRHTACMPKT